MQKIAWRRARMGYEKHVARTRDEKSVDFVGRSSGRPERMWLWRVASVSRSDGFLRYETEATSAASAAPPAVRTEFPTLDARMSGLAAWYIRQDEWPCEPYTQWLGQFTWQHSYKYVTSYVYICACVSNSPSLVHTPMLVRFFLMIDGGQLKKYSILV